MSEVAVVVGDERIPTHSLILPARSKVFAATLQAPMKEAANKVGGPFGVHFGVVIGRKNDVKT